MATRITNASAIAACDSIVDLLDTGVADAGGGAGIGYVEIRTGTQPAGADVAATGTLLGTLFLSATAFGNAVDGLPGGVATAAAITGDAAADASGVAGWFRAYNSDGVAVIDGNITATAGGGDMELNDINVALNATIDVTSWTVTMPEG